MDQKTVERLAAFEEAKNNATTEDIVDMAERVDAQGDVGWLAEPLWPADAYGVLAAKDKAGKTWVAADLAVSVATGTPWLGEFECEQGGAVMYCGEGGARNIVRRIRAVAEHKDRKFGTLRGHLSVSESAPQFRQEKALEQLRMELDFHGPRLVIVDPLYLAAAGGKGSDLYAMGEVLAGVQHICQEAGAALVVTHHWNKTGTGTGIDRMTGVGPTAWGRVLGSGAVTDTRMKGDRSEVEVEWEFVGSEIPGSEFTMTRRVWADDPKKLSSPLHYEVEVTAGFQHAQKKAERIAKKVDAIVTFLREFPKSSTAKVEEKFGRDARSLLATAKNAEMVVEEAGPRNARLWSVT